VNCKQEAALNISRGSVYYPSRPVSASDLEVMRHLDRLHLQFPFAGSRILRGLLAAEGCKIGRRHVKTLMKRMGTEALYCRPRTTKSEPGHKVISLSAARSGDHAAEPRMGNGHHLHPNGPRIFSGGRARLVQPPASGMAAVVDDGGKLLRRGTRRRLGSAHHGKPEIVNTDQGAQFNDLPFTGVLTEQSIAISMDGKVAWRDNVFDERL
jgi:putative transposase